RSYPPGPNLKTPMTSIDSTSPRSLPRALLGLLAVAFCFPGCATHDSNLATPSSLPSHPGLPDPLVMRNGEPVTSRRQWLTRRRPELEALFQHYMYGSIPPAPAHVQARVTAQYPEFLD